MAVAMAIPYIVLMDDGNYVLLIICESENSTHISTLVKLKHVVCPKRMGQSPRVVRQGGHLLHSFWAQTLRKIFETFFLSYKRYVYTHTDTPYITRPADLQTSAPLLWYSIEFKPDPK